MPWAFIVALWHVEGPTRGAYIATTGVATYAPPACTVVDRDKAGVSSLKWRSTVV
jgi:hypothetical protein